VILQPRYETITKRALFLSGSMIVAVKKSAPLGKLRLLEILCAGLTMALSETSWLPMTLYASKPRTKVDSCIPWTAGFWNW
jgi:hypothetical protein